MIEQVLRSPIVWCEVHGDPPEAALLPAEEALVARAVDKRRRDFTTGRHCARLALAQLGIDPYPVLAGPAGEPRWPAGVVGSITHCAGYRAAAVAWAADVATVGIDAEPHEPLPEGVLDVVALPNERARLRELARTSPGATCWDRVLFCAKEAVYKAWYPHAQRMLDFDQARVDFGAGGTLRAELLVPGPTVAGRRLEGLAGRWAAADGLVVVALTEILPP
jgi:4'-phosphopantetheinyl transferase EntD